MKDAWVFFRDYVAARLAAEPTNDDARKVLEFLAFAEDIAALSRGEPTGALAALTARA